jgi:hypothetical protein
MTVCTDAGIEIFADLPNDEYHRRKSHISRSQAHRYRGAKGGRAQRFAEVEGRSLFAGNSQTTFGSLVDTAFECEVRGVDWRTRCEVAPPDALATDGSRRGKAFQQWKASLPADAIECSGGDFEKLALMIDSLREHKRANELMSKVTHSQYSVFRTDANGHRVKARADGVTQDLWFDLKTTSSEWHELKYSFRRFGYDWQAAWYSDAAYACGWSEFVFPFIVVQSFAPYDCEVVTLTAESVERARIEISETLDEMRRRQETGLYVPESYHAERVLDLC